MKDQSKTKQARSESERTKVEQALKESQESDWTILENIQEGYYEVDLAGNYTFFNTSMSKILGYTEEEMMGMNYRLYMDKETTKKVFRDFNEVYRTGISSKVDYEQTKKDGNKMYVETSVALMRDYSGQPTGFRGVVRDITERKRAEEALQRAHDELEQRVADRTEELIRVNEELRAEITERKKAEEALRESEKRYREFSIIDALTQLYNSRHFYQQLKMEIDRVGRYGHPLTLLLLDLDDFKVFNDTYGHIEGDQVLSRLGQVVKRCLRQTDSAYRYGGEEFTILLPMTTGENGSIMADRIRTEFKKENFSPVAGKDVHMTVSIGLAQYKSKEDMEAFVHRVDQLMYQAKKNGKDRVCCES